MSARVSVNTLTKTKCRMSGRFINIILLALMFLCPKHLFSQTAHTLLTLSYKDIKLSDLIDSLRTKGGLKISYDVNAIPVDSVLTINVMDKTPESILRDILGTGTEIIVRHNQAIIRTKMPASKKFTITGSVKDYRDKPLPYVNIALKDKPIGTITNNAGEFTLLLSDSCRNDTLSFSCLGYQTRFIPVASVSLKPEIKLNETSVSLPEIMIKYKNADDIISLFKENQKRNYPEQKELITSFFREAIKEDGRYVNVTEAIVNILKFPYNKPFRLEFVKFVKGRKYLDVQNMEDVKLRLEGGPFYFARIDIARYMDFFPQDNEMPLYKYKLEGLDFEYDKMVFLVSFEPIDDNGELLYKGVLRININTYALISAEFELSKKALKESRKYFIRKESSNIKAKPVYARYYINYRPYNGIWLLNKVKGEMKIKVNDRHKHKKHVFTAVSEMLLSNYREAGNVKFKPSEQFKSDYILTEQIKEYDPGFWKNYNVIKPDEDIENVFKKSHR